MTGLVINDFTYACVKIPTIMLTDSGILIALGEGRVDSCEDVAETHLISRRSFDGGNTWSNASIVYSDQGNVIGNAAPVQSLDGRIFLPFTRNNRETWMTISIDDGNSWSDPQQLPYLQETTWVWVGLGPPG